MKKMVRYLSSAYFLCFAALLTAACVGGGETAAVATPAARTAQTISFPSPGTQTLGVAPPLLAATATSGLPVTFSSESPSVCTVSGATLTLASGGTCSITASQAGDTIYSPATPMTDNFAVNSSLIPQTINFPQPTGETVGQNATISATSSAGLQVSFSTTTSTICSVSGSTVTPLSAGNCIVTASQAGNHIYAAAMPIQRTIQVAGTPVLTFSTGFTNGGLTVDGGGTGGYGGSNLITAGCNGGQYCGGGSAATTSNATSSEYYYIQAPAAATGFQYVGLYVQAPGVTGLSATGNTPGVQIDGQTTMTFTFNQNPEWAAQTSANGGNNILVILTLGNYFNIGTANAPVACNVKLATVMTPTGGAAATTYSLPLSQFTVSQNCADTAINSSATALAANGGGPIVQIDVQGASGNSALTYNGLTSSANTTVATGGYFPTTVSLTGPITFERPPPVLSFSTGFTNGGLTVDGGGTGGYGGSDQITAGCNGGQYCGGGSAANSSNATSSEYYYIQAPAAATLYQYVGLYVQAPGVTGFSTTANTPGVQINGQTRLTFTFNQNPEWAAQTSANGGNNILVILTLGNYFNIGTANAPVACNVKLATVMTPTGGATATTYSLPLSQFTVSQNCADTAINSPAAALAASGGGPVVQIDVQGASGNSALTYGGLTSSANTTVATGGGYFPTTVSLTGPLTFE